MNIRKIKILKRFIEFEEYNPSTFWLTISFLSLAFNFSMHDDYQFSTQHQETIELNTGKQIALSISGGSNEDSFKEDFAIGPGPRGDAHSAVSPGKSQQTASQAKAHARAVETLKREQQVKARPIFGLRGRSTSLQLSALPVELPDSEDYEFDQNEWDRLAADAESCYTYNPEVDPSDNEYKVPIFFNFEKDQNGNPILLVPNVNKDRVVSGRSFNRVEYDQSASHLHHATELNVRMPSSFDPETFRDMKKKDRILWAKQNIPYETIIEFQNAQAKAMQPSTGLVIIPGPGAAGKYETPVNLVFREISDNNRNYYLTIILRSGKHVTTYPVSRKRFREIVKDDKLWVQMQSVGFDIVDSY